MYKISKIYRTISFCVMLGLLLSVPVSISAKSLFDYTEANMVNSEGLGDKKYEQDFLRITELNDYRTEAEGKYFYQPLYEYYNEGDENVTEDSVPDYVLIYAGQMIASPVLAYGKYGDYIVSTGGYYAPYALGYCVYIPEEGVVLDLREAYNQELENIAAVFSDYKLGTLIGDVNNDGKLNVKDATFIQKCLAEIVIFGADDKIDGICEDGSKEVFYISDFNCDGKRNIKDATAIQKYLAEIDL